VAEPLASRIRPISFDEVVGQRHLLGPGKPLTALAESGNLPSMILWGPAGTGKTTLAYLLAKATGGELVRLSAVSSGVADARKVMERARGSLIPTVLFVDEVHRWSKSQQDVLLPSVEDGTVTLIGATTENPYFSLVSPLLSRCLLMRLEPLDEEDLVALVDRASTDAERGLAAEGVALDGDAVRYLAEAAAGDARAALSGLESAVAAAKAAGRDRVDRALAEDVVQKKVVYDRDQHYDVISAFIKSMRGSDPDSALYWLARMIEAGEDPRFVARRMVIFASEDVGLADERALQVAVAAAQAVEFVGLPEVALNLAHAVLYLANAPKSNSVVKALGRAREDAALGDAVPPHLRDSHYPGARKLGHGEGYVYPHDDPEGAGGQAYRPERVQDRRYFETDPPETGSERGDEPGT
jgi:putative ATPase